MDSQQGKQIERTFAKLNRQAIDRRGFLTGAGKLAGAGAIAMALTGTQFSSILANHLGTDEPDLEDGNINQPDPNIEDGGVRAANDCFDFDGNGVIDDFDVLQFALFLEHLEAAFYTQGLQAFTERDFQRGLRVFRSDSLDMSGTLFVNGAKVYGDVARVAEHERAHAEDLTAILIAFGQDPVEACSEYNFEAAFSSVEAFMRTSQLLENTGVAAYVGAVSCLMNRDALRVAASIATVEARHATYFDLMTANKVFPSPYDLARPMETTANFVLGSGLIGACPQAPAFDEGIGTGPPSS